MAGNKTGYSFGSGVINKLPAMTAQKTTLNPADAEGAPDTDIAAITNTSPFGFSNAAEAITLLHTIVNLQTRLAEVETALETIGAVEEN